MPLLHRKKLKIWEIVAHLHYPTGLQLVMLDSGQMLPFYLSDSSQKSRYSNLPYCLQESPAKGIYKVSFAEVFCFTGLENKILSVLICIQE